MILALKLKNHFSRAYKSRQVFIASGLIATLGLQSCANMTPEQKAAIGGALGGIAAGALAKKAGMGTAEAWATGAIVGALVAKVTYDYEVRKANQRQIQVALANARRYELKRAREKRAYQQALARRKKASSPAAAARIKVPPKPKPQSRLVAVETVRTSVSTGKKTAMIYDTKSDKMVNQNAYDIKSTPRNGEIAKIGNNTVEYVAAR